MSTDHLDHTNNEIKPRQKRRTDWYARYPDAYLRGTRRLSLAARGAYSDLLDLMYLEDGPIPDDNRWIACALHVPAWQWRRVREELIKAGKIIVTPRGLMNNRAHGEIKAREERQIKAEVRKQKARKARTQSVREKDTGRTEDGLAKSTFLNVINGGLSYNQYPITNNQQLRDSGEVENITKVASAADKIDAAASLSLDGLNAKLLEAAGAAVNSCAGGIITLSEPLGWLEQGCDLEKDILPVLKAVAAKGRRGINSWAYFTKAVASARAKRGELLPAVDNSAPVGNALPAWRREILDRNAAMEAALKAPPPKSWR